MSAEYKLPAYEFETYETANSWEMDKFLTKAYSEGWFLRDAIRMINTGKAVIGEYEETWGFIYSVTVCRTIGDKEEDIAESIASQKPHTGAKEDTPFHCKKCKSTNLLTRDVYIHDTYFTIPYCADCNSEDIVRSE